MANSVNWTDLTPWIHEAVPGVPQALIIQKVRDTVIDFCHDTQAWWYWIDPIAVEADIGDYDLDDVPNCAVVDHIIQARLSNSDADNVETAGRLLEPDRDYIINSAKTLFRFVRTPTTAVASTSDTTGLLIKVALRPDIASLGMDDEAFDRIWDDWRDTLVAGAKARLQSMPRKTWSNPTEAAENKTLYLQGRTKARIEVNRKGLNLPLRAKARTGWALR